MSQPPVGPPPPPPSGPPPSGPQGGWPPGPDRRRYRAGVVAIAAALTPIGLTALVLGSLALPLVGGLGIFAVPVLLVLAIVFSAVSKGTLERSIWLGIVIGCGISLVVGGGVCVAAIFGTGAFGP